MSRATEILDTLLDPLRELVHGSRQRPDLEVTGTWNGDRRYRNEYKFRISRQDMPLLRLGLKQAAWPDVHAGPVRQADEIDAAVGEPDLSGALGCRTYRIRSLYFDAPGNRALFEKLNGERVREKFRLRYYDGNIRRITLEKKYKDGSAGMKPAAVLSEDEARKILSGDLSWMACGEVSRSRPLITELYSKMEGAGLTPRVIVDYTREPYIFEPGDVRVTLDYNIRTSLVYQQFLDPDCITFPIPDATYLMEVKWDHYLPAAVRGVIWLPERRAGAFSKYAESRIYG